MNEIFLKDEVETILNEMRLFLTNMNSEYLLDKRQAKMILDYIDDLISLKDMYGYFLSVISSNTIRFRKYRENKKYKIIDFDRYDKIVEEEENE